METSNYIEALKGGLTFLLIGLFGALMKEWIKSKKKDYFVKEKSLDFRFLLLTIGSFAFGIVLLLLALWLYLADKNSAT